MKKILLRGSHGLCLIVLVLLGFEGVFRIAGVTPLGVNAERKIFWKYDSTLGWRHEPGQQGVFEDPQTFRTQVNINSKGLRDVDYPYERVPGKRRILVLGDSLAWGFGVEQADIFTEQLEGMLKDVEVINAGVSGYSTDQELLWFRAEGVRYKPDLVILVFCGNDDYENAMDLVYHIYPKPRFELGIGNRLILQNVPVPPVMVIRRTCFQLRTHSALFHYLYGHYESMWSRGVVPDPEAEPFRLTRMLLGEIQETAGRLIIVSTGKYWRSAGRYADLLSALKADGFSVLDVESCAGYSDTSMQFPRDLHWNKNGHQFVAKETFHFLSDTEGF